MVPRDHILDFVLGNLAGEQTFAFLGAGDIGEVADEFASRFENVYTH